MSFIFIINYRRNIILFIISLYNVEIKNEILFSVTFNKLYYNILFFE